MHPLAPGSTTLIHGSFERAQSANANYLLSLDPDRLLAPYMREAGITWPAHPYGNWENSGLDGHTLGHALSAGAHLFSATKNPRAHEFVSTLVDGVRQAQDVLGTGYVGGVPHGVALWDRISSGDVEPDSFGLNGAWVPWYNLHKLFAGLIDAYVLAHNEVAFDTVVRLANWWLEIAKTMSDEAYEAMLRTEFGAMNASYADLYQLTGSEGYLWLARRFSDLALLNPLREGEHILPGMHANTQIAKAYGYARVGAVSNDPTFTKAAATLWQQVVSQHTYVFGGNSVREHFTQDLSAGFESEQGPETCNTYNMLRLTRELLAADPAVLDLVGVNTHALLDYYERALYNHILASQHPSTGGLVYFTPVRPDQYRVYSTSDQCFWCCVGTGIESHARYPEMIFGASGNEAFVNLGVASVGVFEPLGLELEVLSNNDTDHELLVRINKAPAHEVTISVRVPWWSRRNGKSEFKTQSKVWQAEEIIRIPLAKRITCHVIPDDSQSPVTWVAFQRGPLVLAAPTSEADMPGIFADDSRMGHVAQGPMRELSSAPLVLAGDPVALGAPDQVTVIYSDNLADAREDTALHRVLDNANPTEQSPVIALTVVNAENDRTSLELVPLNLIHESRYTMYFPVALAPSASGSSRSSVGSPNVLTPEQLISVQCLRSALAQRDSVTLASTLNLLDAVQCGEQQPESDHAFEGNHSSAEAQGELRWRSAYGSEAYFSYALRTHSHVPTQLLLLVGNQEDQSSVTISLAGQQIARLDVPARPMESEPPFEAVFDLPAEVQALLSEHDSVAVRFDAPQGSPTPRIHSVRLLK